MLSSGYCGLASRRRLQSVKKRLFPVVDFINGLLLFRSEVHPALTSLDWKKVGVTTIDYDLNFYLTEVMVQI